LFFSPPGSHFLGRYATDLLHPADLDHFKPAVREDEMARTADSSLWLSSLSIRPRFVAARGHLSCFLSVSLRTSRSPHLHHLLEISEVQNERQLLGHLPQNEGALGRRQRACEDSSDLRNHSAAEQNFRHFPFVFCFPGFISAHGQHGSCPHHCFWFSISYKISTWIAAMHLSISPAWFRDSSNLVCIYSHLFFPFLFQNTASISPLFLVYDKSH
jgi:hypothetical protein